MRWNYRENGSWNSATLRVRQNGQWVEVNSEEDSTGEDISSPSGWVNTDYLLTGDPPTRSTTVNTSSYSGLQDALDSVGEDTRIVIDDGPYTGNYNLPHTSHLTLDGNGTTIDRSDINEAALEYNQSGEEFWTNTGGVGTYSIGDTTIEVSDSSIFSVDDIIRIYDPDQVHPDMPLTVSGEDDGQGSYHVVTDVDTSNDVLTIDETLFLDWDNPNGNLRVDRIDWEAEDIRITNLTIEGNDDSRNGERIIGIRTLKELWFDNCTVQNGLDGLWVYEGYQVRIHNCVFNNLGNTNINPDNSNAYPVALQNGTHHNYITDSESYDSDRYGFQCGSGGIWWPCRNTRIENCYAQDCTRQGFEQHQGSHFVEVIDCTAQGCGAGRCRSDGYYVQGGGYDTPNMVGYYDRQAHEPRGIVTQQHYVNHNSGRVWQILDESGVIRDQVIFKDCWVEDDGSLNSFLEFETDSSSTCNELVVDHVAVNNTWITDNNANDHIFIEGDWTFGSQTFTAPIDGTTPSEYFSDNYGWTSGVL